MTPQPRRSPAVTRLAVALALCALGALAGGCATVAPAGTEPVAANPIDPWENFNRKVYAFNEGLDEALLRPLAEAYRDVVPELVRTGVDNFFGNVYDAWSAVNQLLQGKLEDSLVMGTRVATNTLFGLGGLLDPATEMRLTRRSEDFGQTLGQWGVPNGPFLMLQLFGPAHHNVPGPPAVHLGVCGADAAAGGAGAAAGGSSSQPSPRSSNGGAPSKTASRRRAR